MSLPNRNNPYSFDLFLDRRNDLDFYVDHPFLQQVLRYHLGAEFADIDARLKEFSQLVSRRWRRLSEINSLPENQPWLMPYDGHNHRIDRIVRPKETEILEREVYGSGLFAQRTSLWERLTKNLLLQQLGEAGINCSLACTEGMLWLIDAYKEHVCEEVQRVFEHCTEGINGDFGIGAQFITEIQGGSDVPANLLEAVPDGNHFRLYGIKYFCSAAHADYAVVTAKVVGSEDVSTFVVPSWLQGNKEREIRNGYEIRRLKRKLGTIELPTAEIEYKGAVAYPVGPLGRGVANIVGLVLTQSRFSVSCGNAGTCLRALQEAREYAQFRTVFDAKIIDLPLAFKDLECIERTAKRMVAGLYKVYHLFLDLGARLVAGLPKDEDLALRKRKFLLRILIMLQKITTAWDTTDTVRLAMSLMGGHGVMECFSPLARLYRDAAINEQWEGPRNLLLHQIHQDLCKVASWYDVPSFIADLLRGESSERIKAYSTRLTDILAHDLRINSPQIRAVATAWDQLAAELFHTYQDLAIAEVEYHIPKS
jgi:alkylation response protein AidB-like acyl-CoA dehydrogenase